MDHRCLIKQHRSLSVGAEGLTKHTHCVHKGAPAEIFPSALIITAVTHPKHIHHTLPELINHTYTHTFITMGPQSE